MKCKDCFSNLNRRDFLGTWIPACTFSCMGSPLLLSAELPKSIFLKSSEQHQFESFSERIPRGLPRGKRANIIVFFLKDRRFPAACGGELQSKVDWTIKQAFQRKYRMYIDRLNRLAKYMGRDQLLEFLKMSKVDYYSSRSSYKPENTLSNFIKPFKESEYFKTIMTIQFIEDTEKVVSWKLTECLHAAIFREHGAADIGFATLCHGDDAWITAYNPNIKFYRTENLVEGHDCCDHQSVSVTEVHERLFSPEINFDED